MYLRSAIAALLACTLAVASGGSAAAQQKVIGPLGTSSAASTAPTPVPLPLPDMARASYGPVRTVPQVTAPQATVPQPSASRPATVRAPVAATAPSQTAPSPGVATVNPRRAPVIAQGTSGQTAAVPDTGEDRPRNAVAFYVGRSATTNFTDMLIMPWKTDFEDTAIVALTYNRRLFTVIDHLDIEAEVGIAKRFGESEAWEINTGILLRWTWFPWNDHVKTTLGISVFGPSYATDISATEKDKSGNDKGNRWLNFFAPELTFADPENPDIEFIFRLHHRSGIFGVYNGVDGGSTFVSTGLRYRF